MFIDNERVHDICEIYFFTDLTFSIGLNGPKLGNRMSVVDDKKLTFDFIIREGWVNGALWSSYNKRAIKSSFIELADKVCLHIDPNQSHPKVLIIPVIADNDGTII